MHIWIIILGLLSAASTLAGGIFAFRNQDKLHRILGFTAGVILGIVAFELLPEIFELLNATGTRSIVAMIALVAGFLLFHIAEKLTLIHHAHEGEYGDHHHPNVGKLSAIALIGHSFLDGIGIGLAFQVNAGVGLAVALAVIAHDFTDGINTVSLLLVNKNKREQARPFLAMDALAPVLGVVATFFFKVPESWLVVLMSFFAGFLLYISAADILPEAHSKHPSRVTLLMTILGVVVIFIITRFAG